ncbi:MAG: relaxase/mobilization nuclease domain-containing protein [Sphingobacterium sp.]
MVAIINEVADMAKIVHYSEQKILQQDARCLDCGNLPLDVDHLDEHTKIALLTNRAIRNRAVRLNSLHITLNFPPSEHRLTDEVMTRIAHRYMDLLGFGQQPYLIYRHLDTAHPHLHLVSTPIRSDGTRIVMHRIGVRRSQPAQKQIEEEFNLLPSAPGSVDRVNSINRENNQYFSVKGYIEKQTELLINEPRITDFEQWNVVLGRLGIRAFKKEPSSPNTEKTGLSYALIDENGRSTSMGIPASKLSTQPKMANLLKIFEENRRAGLNHNPALTIFSDNAINDQEEQNDFGTFHKNLTINQNEFFDNLLAEDYPIARRNRAASQVSRTIDQSAEEIPTRSKKQRM